MTDMNRRTFLTTAALATAGLAGCSSSSPGEGDSGDNKAGGQPTKTLTAQPTSGKNLAFGDTLDLPRVSVTVSNPRTMNSYQWHHEGEPQRTEVAKAGEGKQWLKVDVRAENTTDRTVRLPLTLDFKGVVGERVFHPGRSKSPTGKYIGGKANPGGVHEGNVTFLLPASTSVDQFRVHYSEQRPSGKKEAWWE
jgi:hypothetical protein